MAKIYLEAGRVVDDVLSGSGFKAALYAKQLSSDPRAVCKLASCTLSNKAALAEALEKVGLECHSHGAMLVMTYELLLGHGLRGGGKLRRQLESHTADLQAAFQAFQKSQNVRPVHSKSKQAFAALPRYVRMNRIRLQLGDTVYSEAVDGVKRRLREALFAAYELDLQAGRDVTPEMAAVQDDSIVPELLVLHPSSRSWLQKVPEVEAGALVLQDRSSCLSALAAGLVPGSFVVDSCAAPGSKTAHAIELLRRGRLAAFERDPKRATALVKRLRLLVGFSERSTKKRKPNAKDSPDSDSVLKLGSRVQGRCWTGGSEQVEVDVHVGDFLDTNPLVSPWNEVDILIVDPSCSGSGLPEHHLINLAESTSESESSVRLRRLAAFQKRILSHALRFPRAKNLGGVRESF